MSEYPPYCPKCKRHDVNYQGGTRCPVCGGPLMSSFPCPALVTHTFKRTGMHDGFEPGDKVGRQAAFRKARSAGVGVAGKRFFPSLCRPGVAFDPQAWCSDWDEAKGRAASLGLGMEGHGRELKPIEMPEPEAVPIAEDIVEEETQAIIDTEAGGRLPKKERWDLREKTRKQLIGAKAEK